MTKPDDIEQKHWDVAKSLYLECWDCHGEMLGQGAVCETCRGKGSTPPSQSIVARAIQSAANADMLVKALDLVQSMRGIDRLAPPVEQYERNERRKVWGEIDKKIDQALAAYENRIPSALEEPTP